MRFSFTGTLGYSNSEKRPLVKDGSTKKNKRLKTLALSVAVGKSNRGFVELTGYEETGGDIRCRNTKGENIMVPWEDRDDPEIMDTISSLSKYAIGISGSERKEFLSAWDFVKYVERNIDELSGGKYTVTGRVRREPYKGAVMNHFEIQGIYPAAENAKEALRVTGEVCFTADGIDLSDWKNEKKITVNGYTEEWINSDVGRKLLPQTFIFDASKVDASSSAQVIRTKLRAADLGVEVDDDMNAKVVLKKKKVYRNDFICNYVNGAEEIPFSEEMLTEYQKARIAAGLKTIEDFRPKDRVYGERVVMLKVRDFSGKGKYENGILLDPEMTYSDFEDSIFQQPTNETAEDVLEKGSDNVVEGMNPPEFTGSVQAEQKDLDDLFD